MDDNDLREAMRSSDPRVALEAIRDKLIEGVLAATDRKLIHLAPVTKQLVDVMDKLNSMAVPEGGSASDDLRAKRAARLANAAGQ